MATRTTRHVGVFLIVAACGVMASAPTAQIQAPANAPDSRTIRLNGRVVAADDDAPIARLSPIPNPRPAAGAMRADPVNVDRVAETGADGRFELAGLSPGLYSYVVRDERGNAMPGVSVQALPRQADSGRVTDLGARDATDDRGRFRIFNLTRGDYFIVATHERRFDDAAGERSVRTHRPSRPDGAQSGNARRSAHVDQTRRGDIRGRTITFEGTESFDDVTIEFTTIVAEVEATVVSTASPQAPERAVVVLFPEDPNQWLEENCDTWGCLGIATRTHTAEPWTGRGLARVREQDCLAGPYASGPVLDCGDSQLRADSVTHPRVLERLRPIAVPITLVGGATAKLELRVTPL